MTTLWVVAVAWLVSTTPGLAHALQYERTAVGAGETWRLLTGQLVHWTPEMTCADLGVLVLAGLWLERRAPRVAAATIVAGLLAVGCAVHAAGPGRIDVFRGSSGVGTAMFVAAAVVLARTQPRTGWTLLALLVGKLAAESVLGETGTALPADTLPSGVVVATEAHVAGAIAGATVAATAVGPCRDTIARCAKSICFFLPCRRCSLRVLRRRSSMKRRRARRS